MAIKIDLITPADLADGKKRRYMIKGSGPGGYKQFIKDSANTLVEGDMMAVKKFFAVVK